MFICRFEDELRLIDPTVTLPYWDSTMDYSMDNGVNSIVWSLNFFGNANGEVNTGPSAGGCCVVNIFVLFCFWEEGGDKLW